MYDVILFTEYDVNFGEISDTQDTVDSFIWIPNPMEDMMHDIIHGGGKMY